jgi:hypothetical protein
MDLENVRLIVRRKLVSGNLPQDSISRFWGGLSNGEDCDACEEPIRSDEFIVEAISTSTNHGLQFHIGCFYIWDAERDPSGRLDHVRRRPPDRAT